MMVSKQEAESNDWFTGRRVPRGGEVPETQRDAAQARTCQGGASCRSAKMKICTVQQQSGVAGWPRCCSRSWLRWTYGGIYARLWLTEYLQVRAAAGDQARADTGHQSVASIDMDVIGVIA
jgi:hypothetical protein